MRVVLTAGFDGALPVIALGEWLIRDGHEVAGVLVVNPFNVKRVRAYIRQRGVRALGSAFKRLTGLQKERVESELEQCIASDGITHRSIKKWAAAHQVDYQVVDRLNSKTTVANLKQLKPEAVLYGGGGILRKRFIDAAGYVFNAHSGPLPEVRGMNACEWSLMLGHELAVTIHLIDVGIDTGPVIERIPVDFKTGDTVDQLRGRCVFNGIVGLRRAVNTNGMHSAKAIENAGAERQCFVMSPALLELLQHRLSQGAIASTVQC